MCKRELCLEICRERKESNRNQDTKLQISTKDVTMFIVKDIPPIRVCINSVASSINYHVQQGLCLRTMCIVHLPFFIILPILFSE